MHVAELDYELPEAAIAQVPIEPRDAARLLVDRGAGARPDHRKVRDLPELLEAGDVMVVNETRVRPARLVLRKATGGAAEVLLLEPRDEGLWEALVRPARRVRPGTMLSTADGGLTISIERALGMGRHEVRVVCGDPAAHGEVPLPPYIRTPLADPERYQTVFARTPGSAAAPTAGLHLTGAVLDACRARGVVIHTIDLAIGVDTFRPITEESVEDHAIHRERFSVPVATLDACRRATRVVAVGTTVVRALESAADSGERAGHTALFITRGHRFRLVDVLLTNFHTPRSPLLALVDAFVGPRWRDLYAEALAQGYRFLSFGDAMLLERRGAAR
jgi:S-adenosylmethionine:tRNA ribosyltransferase-isomerase